MTRNRCVSRPDTMRGSFNAMNSGTDSTAAAPLNNAAEAVRDVADQLHVQVENLVMPTLQMLYVRITVSTHGNYERFWICHRNPNGFCSDPNLESLHVSLVTRLRERLICYPRTLNKHRKASRLALEGFAGYPGSDKFLYLALLLRRKHHLCHIIKNEISILAHNGEVCSPQGGVVAIKFRSKTKWIACSL